MIWGKIDIFVHVLGKWGNIGKTGPNVSYQHSLKMYTINTKQTTKWHAWLVNHQNQPALLLIWANVITLVFITLVCVNFRRKKSPVIRCPVLRTVYRDGVSYGYDTRTCKRVTHYWPFVMGIHRCAVHRSPVDLHKRLVMWSFYINTDKLLSKQSRFCWFETPGRSYNVTVQW